MGFAAASLTLLSWALESEGLHASWELGRSRLSADFLAHEWLEEGCGMNVTISGLMSLGKREELE